jgi:pyruvate/2-oxoglutarate dehydrogenase complex dihydrolipoamide dehydrogenase (E3) component
MEEFDVAVLGGGTAGITAAEVAQANGKRVVLIEQARIGGECTWKGCVPSKALIQAARLRHDIGRAAAFGLRTGRVEVDFPAVMASVHEAIAAIAQFEDAAHMEARGIAVRTGHARLSARNTLTVNGDQIRAERIIVCTGSQPSIPPIYRAALSREEAAREVQAAAGAQFDPTLAQAFLAVLSQGKEADFAIRPVPLCRRVAVY